MVVENKQTFFERLAGMPEEEKQSIRRAYYLAKNAHRNQVRESYVRYFEHLRGTALILIDEAGVDDWEMICGGILHDAPEDTPVFGDKRGLGYFDWRNRAEVSLASLFTPRVARMVMDVTKPYIDGVRFQTKSATLDYYLAQLAVAQPDSIVIKMADRLHNLRELGFTPVAKQRRKLVETEDKYFPIFERAAGYGDGRAYRVLDARIRAEVARQKSAAGLE